MSQLSRLNSNTGIVSVAFLLIFLWLFTPYAVWVSTLHGLDRGIRVDVSLIGMVWSVVDFGTEYQRIVINDSSFIPFTVIFNSISLFFVVQVVRYAQSKTTISKALVIGVISIVPPVLKEYSTFSWILRNGYAPPYLGPIPIVFIVGLFLMLVIRRTIPKEEIQVWQ